MYIALKYIGTDFTPGEELPDGLDEGIIKRLLKSGAIRETAPDPAPAAPVTPDGMTDEEKLERTRQNYYAQLRAMGYGPDGNPLSKEETDGADAEDAEDAEEAEETDEEQEPEAPEEAEETDEEQEPEAPEVDVSAALVQETEAEKPKATRARKGGKAK